MKVLTDTRERLPYWATHRRTLVVGDYTTEKLYNYFHIERKSLQDLYGTLCQGNRRFKYELFKAAHHRITICVYVEGTRADFCAKKWPYGKDRKATSAMLDKLVTTFEKKYYLTFHWHHDRNHCKREVEKRLQQEERGLPAYAFDGYRKQDVISVKNIAKRTK